MPASYKVIIGVCVASVFVFFILCIVFTVWWQQRTSSNKKVNDIELAAVEQSRQTNIANRNARNAAGTTAPDPELPSYHVDETPSIFKLIATTGAYQRAKLDASSFLVLLAERILKLESLVTDLDVLLASAPSEGIHPESQDGTNIQRLRVSISELIGSQDEKPLPPPKTKPAPTTNNAALPAPTSDMLDAWYSRALGIASFATTFTTAVSKISMESYDTTMQDFLSSLEELRRSIDATIPPPT